MINKNINIGRTLIIISAVILFLVLVLSAYVYLGLNRNNTKKSLVVDQEMLLVPISEAKILHEVSNKDIIKDTVSYEVKEPMIEVWKFYKTLIDGKDWARLMMTDNFLPPNGRTNNVLMEAINGDKDMTVSLTAHASSTEVKMMITSSKLAK